MCLQVFLIQTVQMYYKIPGLDGSMILIIGQYPFTKVAWQYLYIKLIGWVIFYKCCPGNIPALLRDVYAAAQISLLSSLKLGGCSGRGMSYLEEEVKKLKKTNKLFFISAVFGVKIYSS